MSRHRVGVDARYLTHHAVGGYQTYVQQLMAGFNRIQTEVEIWAILASDAQQIDAIDKLERTVVPVPVPFFGIPVREQLLVTRRASAIGLAAVHYPCNTMPLRPGRASVVTIFDTLALQHRRPPIGLRNRLVASYERMAVRGALRRATLIITPTSTGAGQVVAAGVHPRRVREIALAPNPVFLRKVERDRVSDFRRSHGLERTYLVALASDDPRKNVTAAIDALALSLPRHPDLRLAILMSSEGLRRELSERAESMNVRHRVDFVSRLTEAEMPMLFAGAAAMIFPSLAEGFGLPPLESMACGTPVICSDRPPLDAIYRDTAMMVDPTDTAAMARHVDRLLTEAGLRHELVARGMRLVNERSWDQVAARTVHVYLEAIERAASEAARDARRGRAA